MRGRRVQLCAYTYNAELYSHSELMQLMRNSPLKTHLGVCPVSPVFVLSTFSVLQMALGEGEEVLGLLCAFDVCHFMKVTDA